MYILSFVVPKFLKTYRVGVCLIVFAFIPAVASASGINNYRLSTGDRIEILVHGEEDLSFAMTIGEDGTILYPFVGEIQVSGKTVKEVRQRIVSGLQGDYLDDPNVNVSIEEYRSFYILGEVNQPKAYSFQPGLTVDQAVAMAGGMTERANSESIQLKRLVDGDLQVLTSVSLNQSVMPGDTITVSERFF